ncbi:hypothetical protein BD410DRAFT_836636 [Rickenella mellea]|uniref:Homeobox domain-containing protein n=1 Tax=Rickenella mellea TaxID=50990 RepID=A0A4Y7QE21_9AGAM|nr:hypothetical protein BD410DRAFT_836636 [Rickenella mellea]
MLSENVVHDHSSHYPNYYHRPQAIDVDALAAGVQRHMPQSQAYINLPGVDPATVDFRTFPYNPSEVKHRKRTTRPQQKVLEDTFRRETKPNAGLRKTLAAELGMTPRGVWFQNRRAKEKALAKKARSSKTSTLDSRDDPDHDLDEGASSPPPSASTIEGDSPTTSDQPLSLSPDTSPTLLVTSSEPFKSQTNEDASPKRESDSTPAGLGVSHTSWQQSPAPRSASELDRSSSGNSPPPPEDDTIMSLRRGSLPTHVGSGIYPPPPSAFRVRSHGNGVAGSLGPGGMVGFDPFARRLSLDRLAAHPYAHLAVAANGAVFGPNGMSGRRTVINGRNHSPSHTPQPIRPDLPSSYNNGHETEQMRPELMHRASMPPPQINAANQRDGHVYALSSRAYQAPIPGPLPAPDFSFGTPTSAVTGESDIASFSFPRESDLDGETEEGSAASYDAFSSRFGSIASIASVPESDSSATSAYYSEVGSFEIPPSSALSHPQQQQQMHCGYDQDGRRLSCASTGQFLDMFSNLDVDNSSQSSLDVSSTEGQPATSNGGSANGNSSTSPCGSPSSTVSGGSDRMQTNGDKTLPISQSSELAYALQHVGNGQEDNSAGGSKENLGGSHSGPYSQQDSDRISFVHSQRSTSSGSLVYPLSAASSSSSLGLPNSHTGLDLPDKFVFDNGIDLVSRTGHYSPVSEHEPHGSAFDAFHPLPLHMHTPQMHHQYSHEAEDDRIQLHDALEYSMSGPSHFGNDLNMGAIPIDVGGSQFNFYN